MQDIYQKLLREAEEQDDALGACRILLEMGHVFAGRNESAGALGCFQRALAIAMDLADPALEERALEPLGLVLLHLEGVEEAAACFQRLLEIVRAAGDRASVLASAEVQTLMNPSISELGRLPEPAQRPYRLDPALPLLREIQAEFGPQIGQGFGGGIDPQHDLGRIAGQYEKHRKYGDGDQHQQQDQRDQFFDQVTNHAP